MNLEDRIKGRKIGFDDLNHFLQKQIDPDAYRGNDTGLFGMKSIWNRVAVPVISNLYERSCDKAGKSPYAKSELEDIFGTSEAALPKTVATNVPQSGENGFPEQGEYWRTDGLPVSVYKKIIDEEAQKRMPPKVPVSPKEQGVGSGKPGTKGWLSSFGKMSPRGKAILKNIAIYGSLGLGAGALATGIALMIRANRKKKELEAEKNKKKRQEKKASAKDAILGFAARRISPELNLFDDALRAQDSEDYKDVNEKLRELLAKRARNEFIRINGEEYWPSQASMTFTEPVFRPGDKIYPRSARSSRAGRALDVAYLQCMKDVSGEKSKSHPMVQRWNGLKVHNDYRIPMLTTFAASMLPQGNDGDPNVGYMAYRLPFMLGQTAMDRNMSDDEIKKWIGAGLDKAVMESTRDQVNKYPGVRNIISAYVNGGFGRSGKPNEYGLKDPLWNYQAGALTPYASNALQNVVHDIWVGDSQGTEQEQREMADKHYRELLRFADNVGPSVFKPNTALGNDLLVHPVGGLLPTVDKLIEKSNPYFEQDKSLKDQLSLTVGQDMINNVTSALRSKAVDKAKAQAKE